MDGTNYKCNPALPELLVIADTLDLYGTVSAADFSTNQTRDANCNRIVSLVGKTGSFYLYERSGIFIR